MRKRKYPLALLICGGVLLFAFILLSFFPSWFTPYSPKTMFDIWQQPSLQHIFGTNDVGYDVYTELVYATRGTLVVGLGGAGLSLLIGTLIGLLASIKGIIGKIFSLLCDLFIILPRFLLIYILISYLGKTSQNMILLIGFFTWSFTAKAIKEASIRIQETAYFQQGKILGIPLWKNVLFHLLPHLQDVLIARFLTLLASAIMMESTFAFLGFGDPYVPSWGTMISMAYRRGAFLQKQYATLLAPSFAIALLSLSFFALSFGFSFQRKANKAERGNKS